MAVVSFPLCFGVSGADFWGDLWLCVCRLKQLHQHQWSMWLPTCPPWEAVSHFCCFILLLPLLGQREQGEVCSCCSFPPDTTNPPPTTNRPNHQITKKKKKPNYQSTRWLLPALWNTTGKGQPKTTRATANTHFNINLIYRLFSQSADWSVGLSTENTE